jgi:SAM-dependent methyltransferase
MEALKQLLFAFYRLFGIASRREVHEQLAQEMRRLDAALARSEASHADWQRQIGELVRAVMHKASQDDLQRQVAQLIDRIEAAGAARAIAAQAGTEQTVADQSHLSVRSLPTSSAAASLSGSGVIASPLAQAFYRDLERQFRGTVAEIRDKQLVYRPWIASLPALWPHADKAPLIADLGCGGGEWLALLREWGMDAVGIDSNALNVRDARAQGFQAEQADAARWLAAQPAGSLAAVTAFHLAEHLDIESLLQLLAAARRALMPQGLIIIETPNPENLLVATQGFWLDPTHHRPLPPALLAFMVSYSGFAVQDTLRLNPPDALPWPDAAGRSASGTPADSSSDDPTQADRAMFMRMVSVGRDVAVIGRTPAAPASGAS